MAAIGNRQWIQMPEENLVHIFGFLDLEALGVVATVCSLFKQLQKEESLWCGLFPQIKSLYSEVPEMKERARLSYMIILDNRREYNKLLANICRVIYG